MKHIQLWLVYQFWCRIIHVEICNTVYCLHTLQWIKLFTEVPLTANVYGWCIYRYAIYQSYFKLLHMHVKIKNDLNFMRELLFSIYTRIYERKKFQSIDIINMVLASHIDDRKSMYGTSAIKDQLLYFIRFKAWLIMLKGNFNINQKSPFRMTLIKVKQF